MSIRILLVDDHELFREGIRRILEHNPRYEVVGEASDGREAVEKIIEGLSPQIILMDICMPSLNGIEATRQILGHSPQAAVLAISAHTDRRNVVAMFEAGAKGFLIKSAPSDELNRAIVTVAAGGKYLSTGLADMVINGYVAGTQQTQIDLHSPLGSREREVLQLLAEGRTSKEISSALGISIKTVEVHRRHIMEKLKLHSVAQLTKYAVREGLTSI
jgi:DNA-binding NarL/FixJ family response regulator